MGRSSCYDESGLKKGPWMPEEDEKLIAYIKQNGHGSWRALPKLAGLNRCGKSCRLRWTNYLKPDIKRGKFSQEEEKVIINLHSALGNKWSAIASHLPGRTDNEIKNLWNTHLKKKLLNSGIDPVTHRPRTDHHPDLFANLSQLFAVANLNSMMMKPLDNALRLQEEVAQLARNQLLQQLLQATESSVPQNLAADSLSANAPILGFNHAEYLQPNNNHLEGLINNPPEGFQSHPQGYHQSIHPQELPSNPQVVPNNLPCPGLYLPSNLANLGIQQPSNHSQILDNSVYFGGLSSPLINSEHNMGDNNLINSYIDPAALDTIPPLVSASIEMEKKNMPINSSILIDTWGEINLQDDHHEASD
ncbi:PREDICTED: myb-related protein 315-like [Nelumbo nucifera]|uniref:Myb-related protein 315-like n=2 Tax=Nelumbo nucifera TaxID=4432 RepID=A0A1U7YM65_NELNU|nr:PREDICTED: myb-related protein 315-like [Nelumbo nucifera]XP_010240894.1 PREDICTED: myb-related protein 315-like [Nelumbo nucifera]XP_010240895.1 PREDICTED: myb-related protein 315-like [Nelumbo nucifera]DAD17825.1 TPA_asm: hypothetical protein HUJ06_019288 [Nelumbo nucifera]